MTRAEWLALAVRCEAAQGPDCVLDSDLWRAANGWREDEGCRMGGVWWRCDPHDTIAFEGPPLFTASIDAAMTLVPDKWDYDLHCAEAFGFCVGLSPHRRVRRARRVSTEALSLPLTVCAAACRARAEMCGA